MLSSKARWKWNPVPEQEAVELAAAAGIDKTLAGLLLARGIRTAEEARKFLEAGTDQLHDPFLLDGMHAAVDRIRTALERGEKIRIYGDYDADGVSSTSLMKSVPSTSPLVAPPPGHVCSR